MRLLDPRDLAALQRAKLPRYYFGLDMGFVSDSTALAIVEKRGRGADATYLCGHLQRWPLRTAFHRIVDDVVAMVNGAAFKDAQGRALIIDATGLGLPILEMFRRQPLQAERIGVMITGGATVSRSGDVMHVPKRDLVSVTQVAFQTGLLKIVPSLALRGALVNELMNFRMNINIATGHDSYQAWRESEHDDIVLALGLALFGATRTEHTVHIFRRA